VILDTNALSAFIDGEPAVAAALGGASHVALPVIVLGEFRYGISASRHRRQYERWFDEHLGDFDVLPVTEATTRVYAEVRSALKRSGRPIPANDAWIAALAIEHDQPILTRDDHFDVVAGIRRLNW